MPPLKNMIEFKKWLIQNEGAPDSGSTTTSKQGYDQDLSEPAGLAYRPPTVPKKESPQARKTELLFKGSKAKKQKQR